MKLSVDLVRNGMFAAAARRLADRIRSERRAVSSASPASSTETAQSAR